MSETITKTTQDSDSIELSRNAKGQASWTIKVYGNDQTDLVGAVEELDGRLQEKFGATQGGKE